jgi:hypothetical protein
MNPSFDDPGYQTACAERGAFVEYDMIGMDYFYADQQVQGGFKWSSQHLDGGVCDGHAETAFGSVGSRRVALARPARGGAA